MLRKLKFAATTSWGINARFLIVTQSGRRECNLVVNGCQTENFGHDGLGERFYEYYYETEL
jgi:hypothetical protein